MPRFARIDQERKIVELKEAEAAPKSEGAHTWEPAAAHLKVGDILPARQQGQQGSQGTQEDEEPA